MDNLVEILNRFDKNTSRDDSNIKKISEFYKIKSNFFSFFTLYDVFKSLGCFLPPEQKEKYFNSEQAAEKINNLIQKKQSVKRYICPLEYFNNLPKCVFGSAKIGKFSEEELFYFFDAKRLICLHPEDEKEIIKNIEEYSQFYWMIFEESVELKDDFMNGPQFEETTKQLIHQCRFPNNFQKEAATFLLAPWEEWETILGKTAWKFFKIPWVYEVDGNLFIPPCPLPSYQRFNYDIKLYEDSNGEVCEYEQPLQLDLITSDFDQASDLDLGQLPLFFAEIFEKIDKNLFFGETALFFLINAYDSDGIYEFISHITAIEAAIGQQDSIRVKGKNKKLGQFKQYSIGITRIVAIRIAALLKDVEFYHQYIILFKLRSNFIHGSDEDQFINDDNKIKARRLTRMIVTSLLNLDAKNQTKEEMLRKIFNDGVHFLQQNDVEIIKNVEISKILS